MAVVGQNDVCLWCICIDIGKRVVRPVEHVIATLAGVKEFVWSFARLVQNIADFTEFAKFWDSIFHVTSERLDG